ncbi:MAG: alanine racemase, partial [Candidatus Cloacimonetes bacterium]|nr:alanine racemase [Candidatus Cloacimonadota bacterium]
DNINALKQKFLPHQQFMQIVKADAYGHGAPQIALQAVKEGAVMLGVANVEEATLLRFHEIEIPILILSPSFDFEIESIIHYKLIPSVSNIDFVKKLNQEAKKLGIKQPVHIKCDTGMNRNGIRVEEAFIFYNEVIKNDHIKVEGIFSHFSSSENDKAYTLYQYHKFIEAIQPFAKSLRYIHIANSSAVANYQFSQVNLHRLGLLSYGVYSDDSIKSKVDLKPVMTFKSRISHISTARENETIGYNRTYQVKKPLKYAIIPVGYADGYDFLLSGKANTECHEKSCPVLGKVSMDMIAIDISHLQNVLIGDEVTLLGGKQEFVHAEVLSALFKGSSYELLTQIGRRAKRYFIKEQKISDSAPILRRDFIPKDFSDDKLNRIIHQAIEERIHKKELAGVIYHDILKYFFVDSDRDVSYRSNFVHSIRFLDENELYYTVETHIEFDKILQNPFFIVACANNQENLELYFKRRDTEYRWLLDEDVVLDESKFIVSSAKINDIVLTHKCHVNDKALEIRCESDQLQSMLNQLVHFEINTRTLYPKMKHQLSIYLSEITKGIMLEFEYPETIQSVECIPIFSGRRKYPDIEFLSHRIKVSTRENDWVFPNSGVVFTY